MPQSILVAYATRYGSTQEVAETIKASLRDAGLAVDLRSMPEVGTLDAYAAVVLGAAIYNAPWHSRKMPFGPNPRTLFMGGSAVLVDADARLSFAYVMNNCPGTAMEGDDRAASLGSAAYAAL